ncbi:acetyl transferase [Fulvimarina pelagi HTCC2506]|uniref:Acetyl transferase n=2 Tax=Fulvimarina pelagi TaxID=217511 RepID=Q0FZS3_9HYPH|nr:acetyl transferase [Fulvimarina pelagi HTCC2506]BAT31543.1 acetyl transferase [Fulvimarina pelagi]
MSFAVRAERFLGDDVRSLVMKLDEALLLLAPPEFHFGLNFDEMTRADVTVFVCRDRAGEAVAMGTLKTHAASVGEVKRMYTDPSFRGRGLGRAILSAIIERARTKNMERVVLETGAQDDYRPAWALYESLGFSECDAVLDYPASEYSRFYEKTLSE